MHQMFIYTGLTGIVLLVVGCIIYSRIGRRRFNRTAKTGVEIFRSYGHKVTTRAFERLGRLIALLLIVFGLMIALGSLLSSNFYKQQKTSNQVPHKHPAVSRHHH
jgi:hypothetical protein